MKRLFQKNKSTLRQVRHARVRAKLMGTKDCPRLSVFRSLKNMEVQLVDDEAGKTLCAVHTNEITGAKGAEKTHKVTLGYEAGKLLAQKAKAKGIAAVIFDRGGYRYHGRVKAVAEGAREAGLVF